MSFVVRRLLFVVQYVFVVVGSLLVCRLCNGRWLFFLLFVIVVWLMFVVCCLSLVVRA